MYKNLSIYMLCNNKIIIKFRMENGNKLCVVVYCVLLPVFILLHLKNKLI